MRMSEIDADAAMIGHNQPPEPTPFDKIKEEIEGLYGEAKHWLTGEAVKTQAEADEIAKLVAKTRAAEKTADERRIAENKPFDDGKAEVQSRYNPMIQKDRGKTQLIMAACKKALAPFLIEQQRQRDEEIRIANEKAQAAQREAQEAMRAARESADLEAREHAETLARRAKGAERDRKDVEKLTPKAVGGGARAMTLRTRKIAKIVDLRAFSAYIWTMHKQDLEEWASGYAQQLCTAGIDPIPGVEIETTQVAQ